MISKKKEWIIPFCFICPAMFFVIFFIIYPFFYSIYISFTDMSLLDISRYSVIGFKNYISVFTNNDFFNSLRITIIFVIIVIVFQFFMGFLLALLLNKSYKLTSVIRTSVMLPWVLPPVALGLIWQWFLRAGQTGLINSLLGQLGVTPVEWLGYDYVLKSIIFVTIWIGIPFSFMLELAGLQKISNDIYEAAEVDGASQFKKLMYITVPLMKKTFLLNWIMITIATIGYFDIIYALTKGGPDHASEVLPLFMYNKAFEYFELGTGASIAVVLLLLSLAAVICYLRIFRTQGGEDQ